MHPLVEHLYWEKLSPVQGGIVFAEGFRWKFVLAANDRAAPTRQFAGLRPCCATPIPSRYMFPDHLDRLVSMPSDGSSSHAFGPGNLIVGFAV